MQFRPETHCMTRALFATLLVFAAILGVALLRYTPPAPRGPEVEPTAFSAARARGVQRVLSEDGASRAIGTDANASSREYLKDALERVGFTTEIQEATSCSRHAACARVANVIGTRTGREPDAGAVLLMAHYDSVPCGPGASDDGMGTSAVLEAARAIGVSPPLRRTVVVVLTDGEEAGLLGAEAFVRQHRLARTIHGAVNVDARGTTGPSAMFETSAGNAWLVGLLARHAERPVTSSLFYEIYRRMPNDTDFTSVKGSAHGVNFANIARVERYHTPLDSFANADPGTLQHHGDQALAMVRALADAGPELEAPRDAARDAVWFDVLAVGIIHWPVGASLGLALTALALVVGWAIRMRAGASAGAGAGAKLGVLAGLAASGAAAVAALVASLVVGALLKACGASPVPWPAHPLPSLVSLHLACMSAGLLVARALAARSSAQALWAGTWLTWGLLGVVTAVVAPGACFLFVVPTLAAGLFAWLRIDAASAVPACVAAVLWMPIAVLVYDGLGLMMPAAACVSSTVLVTTLPALAASRAASEESAQRSRAGMRRLGLGAAAAVVIAGIVACVSPVFSADRPQRVNVVFRQDTSLDGATPRARVFVEAAWAYRPWGAPPAAMLRALDATAVTALDLPTPWSSPVPFAETERVAMDAPKATVLESVKSSGGSRVRLRVESPRGARTIAVVLPEARRTTMTVEGQLASARNGATVLRAVPREGLELTLDAQGEDPIVLTLLDITPGLPPANLAPRARAVLDARPREATQTQEGDVTIVARRLQL